ncbi:hypothetical protein C8R32_10175 [Nitrosospira sp. Nsp5]|uniref:Uncharacterized protein n=1 Tax=Nitrosospira multiformis TaxID=1231 RepID=A0ABY0THI7_9PROT|nr:MULTISPECIES: hypothetical protein [Nitrosospira]PTR10548.1 hypothetical protein C8R32_10175 [Nitrosospira sp. Nsp5]SDQ81151.1 hypothetical protein SAMN05216402_2387 [Nitrosospira multiformis]
MNQYPMLKGGLADSILRNIMSPSYYFHVPVGERTFAYPLFSRELSLYTDGSRGRALLHQSMAVLDTYGLQTTSRYLAWVFNKPCFENGRSASSLEAFIEGETYDLCDCVDSQRFSRVAPIPLQGRFGIRTAPRPRVLILGAFFPADYAIRLFDNPTAVLERLATEQPILPFERTVMVCHRLRLSGLECMTSMTHARDILNLFLRVHALMHIAEHIVVLLTPGSSSVAMEYGVVCADPTLARKAVVLVPRDSTFITMGIRGTFMLEEPKHFFYASDGQIPEALDQAIAYMKGLRHPA